MDQCEVKRVEVEEGETVAILVCPWHACTFDLRTGESADTHNYKLDTAPKIEVDEKTGEVTAL